MRVGGLLLFWLLATGVARAAPPGITVEPTPGWVVPIEPVRGEDVGGLAWDLFDKQLRVVGGTHWLYVHVVLRVTSDQGTTVAGQREFVFTPPHERLTLHRLDVRRGGETSSRLRLDQVQLLQRETSLESSVYVGAQTALMVLEDLRVGDVVEYAFSIVGKNPVLAGHISDSFDLAFPIPAGLVSYLVTADRRVELRRFAGAPLPDVTQDGALTRLAWRAERTPAMQTVPNVPSEHFLRPSVQLTDYRSWAEVAEWAVPLYAPPPQLPRSVAAVVAEIKAHEPMPGGRARAALRFVQDEVRYFAFALGEGTHRPSPLEKVLERRFGDCKDKSRLLMTLLEALDIRAHVALVRADGGAILPELLPSPEVFDHVIVVAEVDGERLWFDPTLTLQRGSLRERHAYAFHALIVAPGTTALTAITVPKGDEPETTVLQTYRFADWGQPVTLEVRATHSWDTANSLRASRASRGAQAYADDETEHIRRTHATAVREGELVYEDSESDNRITLVSRFRLDSVWKETNGQQSLVLTPVVYSGYMPTAHSDRTAPLLLFHPLWLRNQIVVETPVALEIPSDLVEVTQGPFAFSFRSKAVGRRLELSHELQTKARRVEVAELAQYTRDLAKIDETSYTIWSPATETLAPAGPDGFNATMAMLTGLWALVTVFFLGLVYRRAPFLARPNIAFEPSLDGFGGWLILLAVNLAGLVVHCGELIADAATVAFSSGLWHALTSPGGEGYHPAWAPLILLQLLGAVSLLAGSLCCLVMMFKRHRSFPVTTIGLLVALGLLVGVQMVLMGQIPLEVTEAERPRPQVVVFALIWSAYLLMSRRVRSTFLPA